MICSEKGFALINGPLKLINSLDGTIEDQVHQFVSDLSVQLKITPEKPQVFNEIVTEFCNICKTASQEANASEIDQDKVITRMKKSEVEIQGKKLNILEIFKAVYRSFALGARSKMISGPLFTIVKKTVNDTEIDIVIAELTVLGLINHEKKVGQVYFLYYLTKLGNDIILKIKDSA